uniref:C-type lectin domain-containing protein n=1 Tax=Leptobrachium leishanense TaxID=445787 RepID=A0A8C5WH92_9ANUR
MPHTKDAPQKNIRQAKFEDGMEMVYVNFRKDENQINKKTKNKDKCRKLVPILGIVLIITFLILSIFVGLLFMCYSALRSELTELKQKVHDNILPKEESLKEGAHSILADIKNIKKQMGKICPDSWSKNGSFCYYVSENTLTWDKARDECRNFYSELIIISSTDEMNNLGDIYQYKQRYWIGLRRDINDVNTWKWLDGTQMTFSNWNKDEPNNDENKEHCAESMSGPWNDQDCSRHQRFICKKVLSYVESTPYRYFHDMGDWFDMYPDEIQN